MVFASVQQNRQSYHLWRRFSYPGPHGLRDAIAVSSRTGDQLVSAYSILLEVIFVQVWIVAVHAAVHVVHRGKFSPKATALTVKIYDTHRSPSDAAKSMVKWWWRQRHLGTPLLWAAGAVVARVAIFVLPIVIIPSLTIGNGAPVAVDKIYVPSLGDPTAVSVPYQVRLAKLENPAAMRASGIARIADSATKNKVRISSEELPALQGGEQMIRVHYHYTITARDLGMQKYADLSMNVEGSCTTEYGWFLGTNDSIGWDVDSYALWNGNQTITVSPADGELPRAFFYINNVSNSELGTNSSYAIAISSVGRNSTTSGHDPWYLTGASQDPNGLVPSSYHVLPGRPVLSCWEMDSWLYRNHSTNTVDLTSLPGLKDFPYGMQLVLAQYLSLPKIILIGGRLGSSALQSSTSSFLGNFFDAGSNSMFSDIQQLVLTSYIASVNTLSDTTLYPYVNFPDIPNTIDVEQRPQVGWFVVYSKDISTISIRVAIIIPVVSLALWIAALLFRKLEEPRIEDLKAEVSGIQPRTEPEHVEQTFATDPEHK